MATATTSPTTTVDRDLDNLDRNSLIDMLIERDKRIQELERLLEDQKRLRLQDSSQVEEKAAKIKEWVTNKLKELENQNKRLREQNKKQKEAVESLNIKLATLTPVSSPRKRNTCNNSGSLDKVQYIEHNYVPSSPIDTIDVNQSLKTRRPQLKNSHLIQQQQSCVSSSSEEDGQNLRIDLKPSRSYHHQQQQTNDNFNNHINSVDTGVSLISIGDHSKPISNDQVCGEQRKQQDSPLYDSVNIETFATSCDRQQTIIANHSKSSSNIKINGQPPHRAQDVEENHYDLSHYQAEPSPPPPPLHQFDRWERELYDLAEQTFSSLMQNSSELDSQPVTLNDRRLNSRDSPRENNPEFGTPTRKSSSSLRNDIISVIKPSFTTIDGDQVVDSEQFDSSAESNQVCNSESGLESLENQRNSSNDHSSRTSSLTNNQPGRGVNSSEPFTITSQNGKSHELIKQKSIDSQNLFSSPIRSRSGKDSMLRTQSVRRNPAPEKLYDFISADLVKRGYLVKHGALRSHNRWFVLKNFHLYSYKRESEETDKASPTMSLKLEPSFQIQITSQTNDGYPFKITYPGGGSSSKSLILNAESARSRDEWTEILTIAINMSDIEADKLGKHNSQHEGIVTVTRHGHTKRCHAVLVKHVVFFLKSPIDPTPVSYLSVKSARIREVMDNYGYDLEVEQDSSKQKSEEAVRDCSLAIYPRFSMNLDPVYLTFGSQQDTDEWFYHLSEASGLDQSSGTQYERVVVQITIDNSIFGRKNSSISLSDSLSRSCCPWAEHPVMVYSDRPISQPLTSLPNETLRVEAVEMFKSILLFTHVLIEPIAVDYHVCLLQNCLLRFLKHPELRNEFFAQLIKQSTYVVHRCSDRSKLSSISSSGSSSTTQRSSMSSLSPTVSECQFVTDLHMLDSECASRRPNYNNNNNKCESTSSVSHHHSKINQNDLSSSSQPNSDMADTANPPTQSELLQVMQILALAVSLNLPKGRLRWWLTYHLRKFANPTTSIGKYALFTLKAIERTSANGGRDNAPARTEILGILLRNPYDHSTPHSLPVSFADGSYLLVGADGSTTIEEFMTSMSKSIQIRPSPLSDFYLFADDPGNTMDLHILEPQRKVLDVVGWWEQSFKQSNIGRQQNTRVIKLLCKKRLLLNTEDGETDQERLFIVHQVNQEICSNKIPLSDVLAVELAAIMTQLTFGDFERSAEDQNSKQRIRDHIQDSFLPRKTDLVDKVLNNWPKLSGKNRAQCVRVYLNCIRRLKLSEP
uniref:Uncharacterized protein CG42248 n=1 Tax=Aceria tosichella TaxID=561515 RepID=A0A6G1SIT1_9ACAR